MSLGTNEGVSLVTGAAVATGVAEDPISIAIGAGIVGIDVVGGARIGAGDPDVPVGPKVGRRTSLSAGTVGVAVVEATTG